MKITLAYICVANGPITYDYALRFVSSYLAYPPGEPHNLLIICNGGPVNGNVPPLFFTLPESKFFPRSNEGWDIGGYIDAAKGPAADSDMLVCMGESVYFHRRDWLRRLVDCWGEYGPGIYGSFSSYAKQPHLNTSGFATTPELLRGYPRRVNSTKEERYEFEHGEHAFWRWVQSRNMPAKFVTWDGCWSPREWRFAHNILWRGNQSNLLMKFNHTDGYAAADDKTKKMWERMSDQPFL